VPLGERRYFEIQYEALTGNPEGELRKVCNFLGVEFTPAMLESSRSGKRIIGLGSARIRPNERNYAVYFSKAQCERLDKIAGSTLTDLGYTSSNPQSDVNPPATRLRLWMFRDRLRIAASTVLAKLTSRRRFSWNLIFGKLKRDLRQSRIDDT
jgi:hypothetical protein